MQWSPQMDALLIKKWPWFQPSYFAQLFGIQNVEVKERAEKLGLPKYTHRRRT